MRERPNRPGVDALDLGVGAAGAVVVLTALAFASDAALDVRAGSSIVSAACRNTCSNSVFDKVNPWRPLTSFSTKHIVDCLLRCRLS